MGSPFIQRLRNLAAPPLLALALLGCAGQMAYRDSQSLAREDKIEAALGKLQEAIAADPQNPQFRTAYLQLRDRYATRYVNQAMRELENGQTDQAAADFRRALAIDAGHERARQGLRALEADARLGRRLADAQGAFDRKDYAAARSIAEDIMTERPQYEPARQLLSQIDELASQTNGEASLAAAYKQPVTIEFRDAPLKQVFEVLSRRSGLNFLFDKDVKTDQRTSIFLKNSTVEAAIDSLLLTNQLEQRVMDPNTILIYPNLPQKQKEYQQMVVKTFYLANAEAKSVANTLKTILKSRDVVVDEKLNLLIVRDSPEAIRLAEKLVALQDISEAEVMLEVEILEINRSRLTELGISWPEKLALAPLITGDSPITIAELKGLNSYNVGVSGVAASVNAHGTADNSNLLANPRIRVRNKEKAKVLIGQKIPNITTTVSPGANGFASESINYVDVGLTLNVEPTIYLNNEVGIRVALEVSNVIGKTPLTSGAVAYTIGTRQASTFLQLKDGENQVLAGLINKEERNGKSGLPILSEVPLLGRLFGSGTDDSSKSEIVLSITPHLIRSVQRPPASASEFVAGTETSFRRRPDTTPRQSAVPVQPGQTGTVAPAIRPGVANIPPTAQQPVTPAVVSPATAPTAVVPGTPSAQPAASGVAVPTGSVTVPATGVQVAPVPAPPPTASFAPSSPGAAPGATGVASAPMPGTPSTTVPTPLPPSSSVVAPPPAR